MSNNDQINSVLTHISKVLLPPLFPDDEHKTRLAYRLTVVSLVGNLITVVYAFVWLFAMQAYISRLLFAVPLFIIFVGVFILVKTGYVYTASQYFLGGLWLAITVISLTAGGTRSPFFGFYSLVVLSAVIFVGWKTALFYGVLSFISGLSMVVLSNMGWIAEPLTSPVSALLTQTAIMIFVTLDGYIIVQDIRRSLLRTQQALAERDATETALCESEERFRLISSVTSDYTFSSRLNAQNELEHLVLTGAFEQISGYSPEEFLAIGGWRATLHPDDLAQDDQDMATLRENKAVTTEIRIINKRGEVRWVRVHALPVWDTAQNRLIAINGGVRDVTERTIAEDALRESEKRYRIVTEMISDYAFAYDILPDGTFTPIWITHDSFKRITGYEWGDIGATYKLYHPDDVETVRQHVRQTLDGQPMSGDYRIITQSGEVRWLSIHRMVEWDEAHNRPIRFYGVAQDITDRKLAADTNNALNHELQVKASQLEILNEIARDISTLTDLSNTLKHVLQKFQAVLPLDAFYVALYNDETQGITFPILYDSGKFWDQEPGTLNRSGWVAHVLETGQPILVNRTPQEIEYNSKQPTRVGDTNKVSASILMAPLPLGNRNIGVISIHSYTPNSYSEKHIDLLVGAAYQIAIAVENARLYDSLRSELAERTRLEAELQDYTTKLEKLVDERTNALRRAKEQLELVLNSTTNALAFADPQGDILVTNPAFRATFTERGSNSIEFILWSLANEDQVGLVGDALLKVIYDSQTQRIEAQIVSQEGQSKDIDLVFIPVNTPDNVSRNGVLVSGHDITQIKEIERLKARFVADAVHDLATPITGLSTRLYLLKRSPEKLADHVRALENQVQHLRSLLDDLRTLSQMDRRQMVLGMEKCRIEPLIQRVFDTYEPVALEKQQSLQLTIAPDLPSVPIDERQIERALVNLVSNAINYTPAQKTVYITAVLASHMVMIRVADEGIGISAEDLPYIFDRFYRTAEARKTVISGTGLGLAITKEIVEMHGGTVAVTSEPGMGSTFIIYLPA